MLRPHPFAVTASLARINRPLFPSLPRPALHPVLAQRAHHVRGDPPARRVRGRGTDALPARRLVARHRPAERTASDPLPLPAGAFVRGLCRRAGGRVGRYLAPGEAEGVHRRGAGAA